MPAENPPSYDTAIHASPKDERANLERSRTHDSDTSDSSDGLGPALINEDDRKSMDDEQRDLPPGWVRCFDPKTQHHFYVEEATKRSIWIHPYDDPEFLNSLPDTHPANPNSKQGKAIRKRTEEELEEAKRFQEERQRQRGGATGGDASGNGNEHRNWFQKKKDKLIGTKEEREKAKEDKRRQKEEERRRLMQAQQEYVRRRKELIEQQLNDPSIRRYYASNPYGYAPPSMAFSRAGGMYGSPYGYGYGGGYGRRYGYGGGMGMGMGMPLMAGMGGGLLLGSALGGF